MSVWEMCHLVPNPERQLVREGIMEVIMENKDYINTIVAHEFSYAIQHHRRLVRSSRALEKIGGFIDSISTGQVQDIDRIHKVIFDNSIQFLYRECYRFWIAYYTLQKLVKEQKLKLEDVITFKELEKCIGR